MYRQACSRPQREQHKHYCSEAAGNYEELLSLDNLCTHSFAAFKGIDMLSEANVNAAPN